MVRWNKRVWLAWYAPCFAICWIAGGCRVPPAAMRGVGDSVPAPSRSDAQLATYLEGELPGRSLTVERPPPVDAAVCDFKESLETPKTLDQYLQVALAGHPKILAARNRVAAAQHRIPQASALADPRLDTTFWPIQANSLQTAGGRMTDQVGVSQEIPFPEKRWTRAAIAERELQMAIAEVEAAEREITESVRLAYYEFWFASRAIEIVTQNRQWVAEFVKVAEARYRTGGSQQDVLRAELEREKIDQRLLELRQQRSVAEADLAALIQLPEATDLQTESELPIRGIPAQLQVLIQEAEKNNPELKGLASQVQRDAQRQRLACLQQYPDLSVGTQWGMMSNGGAISPVADGRDMVSFSVGVTLPIWREKIRAGICEAAAVRTASQEQLESEKLTIAGRLRRLLAEAQSLDQQYSLFVERVSPKAEQALQVAANEYTVGKTTFVQLVENYSDVLNFQLQAARIEATLAGTLAEIERAVGRPSGYESDVSR